MRARDRSRVLGELCSRVMTDLGSTGPAIDEIVADSVYYETRRLRDDRSKDADADRAFWRSVREELGHASEHGQRQLLRRIVGRYGDEIAGEFNDRVYAAVTKTAEPAMALLLNAVSPLKLLRELPSLPRLDDAVIVQGEQAWLKRLHERGTIILVPTHVSHLDSLAVGFGLFHLGLPPFLYGAGLNLFSNPMLGFFLRNLGAYTVDRRKQDPLYKRVLKDFATLSLENGYHNIFFPGGTRSRAGALERKLKLGLLGSGVSAFVRNLQRNAEKPNIWVVPATLSFQLVLEAETLIDDFLKEVGKSRYIITDDEFSQPRRIYSFLSQLLSLDSKIYFTVGRPLDVFGNDVDHDGVSIDPMGRAIDPSRYLIRDGAFVHDEQRDAEYTREVGERVMQAYRRDTIVQSTHITARAAFGLLRRANRGTDLVRLIGAGGRVDDFPLIELYREVDRLLVELRGLAERGGVRLGPFVVSGSADDVVADGLRHFAIYHLRAALSRRGDRVFSPDRALLFYYSNRLEGFRLERDAGLAPALTPDHRAVARGV